jgi:TonB family protein
MYGDPMAAIGPPSNGPGSGGGIGTGSGGGVGSGRGGGYGPGSGGGAGGGAFRIGGGVSSPVLIYKIEPEYSEEARKAKWQGTVILAIVVGLDGRASNITVVRPLGMGLDEKAIEAVQKWRFRPGLKDGRAVPVQANVEVNFRLL